MAVQQQTDAALNTGAGGSALRHLPRLLREAYGGVQIVLRGDPTQTAEWARIIEKAGTTPESLTPTELDFIRGLLAARGVNLSDALAALSAGQSEPASPTTPQPAQQPMLPGQQPTLPSQQPTPPVPALFQPNLSAPGATAGANEASRSLASALQDTYLSALRSVQAESEATQRALSAMSGISERQIQDVEAEKAQALQNLGRFLKAQQVAMGMTAPSGAIASRYATGALAIQRAAGERTGQVRQNLLRAQLDAALQQAQRENELARLRLQTIHQLNQLGVRPFDFTPPNLGAYGLTAGSSFGGTAGSNPAWRSQTFSFGRAPGVTATGPSGRYRLPI